ncbi:uncharacterized protein [Argopecten irradians]|uniref:uncharacterized protein isoform X1 n=2 Tax=Argopecten irradians TaxID=31199 RepID=UPI00370FD527
MCCKSFLINVIKVVGGCPMPLGISCTLVTVALILTLIGMTTSNWMSESTPDTTQGLFWYCVKQNNTECCAQLEEYVDANNMEMPEFIQATRVFAGMGVCLLFGTMVLCAYTIRESYEANAYIKYRGGNIAATLVSGLAVLITVCAYGDNFPDYALTNQMGLSWSFGFNIAALGLCVINVIVLCTINTEDL